MGLVQTCPPNCALILLDESRKLVSDKQVGRHGSGQKNAKLDHDTRFPANQPNTLTGWARPASSEEVLDGYRKGKLWRPSESGKEVLAPPPLDLSPQAGFYSCGAQSIAVASDVVSLGNQSQRGVVRARPAVRSAHDNDVTLLRYSSLAGMPASVTGKSFGGRGGAGRGGGDLPEPPGATSIETALETAALHLDLTDADADDWPRGVALLSPPHHPGLERLTLDNNKLGERAALSLAVGPATTVPPRPPRAPQAGVTRMKGAAKAWGNEWLTTGRQTWGCRGGVPEARVGGNVAAPSPIGPDPLRALPPTLRRLSLAGNLLRRVPPALLSAGDGSPLVFPRLEHLALGCCRLSGALPAGCLTHPTLLHLGVPFNAIDRLQVAATPPDAVGAAGHSSSSALIEGGPPAADNVPLRSLDLSHNAIADLDRVLDALAPLAGAGPARRGGNLRLLSLRGNPCCLVPNYRRRVLSRLGALTELDGAERGAGAGEDRGGIGGPGGAMAAARRRRSVREASRGEASRPDTPDGAAATPAPPPNAPELGLVKPAKSGRSRLGAPDASVEASRSVPAPLVVPPPAEGDGDGPNDELPLHVAVACASSPFTVAPEEEGVPDLAARITLEALRLPPGYSASRAPPGARSGRVWVVVRPVASGWGVDCPTDRGSGDGDEWALESARFDVGGAVSTNAMASAAGAPPPPSKAASKIGSKGGAKPTKAGSKVLAAAVRDKGGSAVGHADQPPTAAWRPAGGLAPLPTNEAGAIINPEAESQPPPPTPARGWLVRGSAALLGLRDALREGVWVEVWEEWESPWPPGGPLLPDPEALLVAARVALAAEADPEPDPVPIAVAKKAAGSVKLGAGTSKRGLQGVASAEPAEPPLPGPDVPVWDHPIWTAGGRMVGRSRVSFLPLLLASDGGAGAPPVATAVLGSDSTGEAGAHGPGAVWATPGGHRASRADTWVHAAPPVVLDPATGRRIPAVEAPVDPGPSWTEVGDGNDSDGAWGPPQKSRMGGARPLVAAAIEGSGGWGEWAEGPAPVAQVRLIASFGRDSPWS